MTHHEPLTLSPPLLGCLRFYEETTAERSAVLVVLATQGTLVKSAARGL